jgi:hypothetical protein
LPELLRGAALRAEARLASTSALFLRTPGSLVAGLWISPCGQRWSSLLHRPAAQLEQKPVCAWLTEAVASARACKHTCTHLRR